MGGGASGFSARPGSEGFSSGVANGWGFCGINSSSLSNWLFCYGGWFIVCSMNFKEDLNAEQYAAVTAPDGPALVVAAAGTGKTRTLIYRLAWLVKERG